MVYGDLDGLAEYCAECGDSGRCGGVVDGGAGCKEWVEDYEGAAYAVDDGEGCFAGPCDT